jgi:hypothetical protein
MPIPRSTRPEAAPGLGEPATWRMVDQELLVAYDYGTGGSWGVLIAPSEEAILKKYPELQVAHERPDWMDEGRYEELRSEPLWLDDQLPVGLLRAVVADRDNTSVIPEHCPLGGQCR